MNEGHSENCYLMGVDGRVGVDCSCRWQKGVSTTAVSVEEKDEPVAHVLNQVVTLTTDRGSFITTHSVEEIKDGLERGDQWIELKPSGTLLNLDHVVTISAE